MVRRQERSFDRFLPNGDAIRVRFSSERGRIVAFAAQLEVLIEGTYRPAERYDTAHSRAHRDTLDWFGNVIDKHWLPAELTANEALTFAERDLRSNARGYREAFLRRRP